MPIYEYQCRGCEHEFETIQKISEAALTTCPSCGKDLLKKKISAVAFRLKGAGWYETDFKSGDKRNVAGRDDASETKAGGSSGDSNTSSKDGGGAATKGASESTSTASNGGSAKETAKPAKEAKTDSAKPSTKTESKGTPKD